MPTPHFKESGSLFVQEVAGSSHSRHEVTDFLNRFSSTRQWLM